MHEAQRQSAVMGWYVERSGVYEFVRGGNVRNGLSEPPDRNDKEMTCFNGKPDQQLGRADALSK